MPQKRDLFLPEDTDKILNFISLASGTPIGPGEMLLFLDEIQRAPEVFAKLRYFFENRPDIHIISAGSLLDFIHVFSIEEKIPVSIHNQILDHLLMLDALAEASMETEKVFVF